MNENELTKADKGFIIKHWDEDSLNDSKLSKIMNVSQYKVAQVRRKYGIFTKSKGQFQDGHEGHPNGGCKGSHSGSFKKGNIPSHAKEIGDTAIFIRTGKPHRYLKTEDGWVRLAAYKWEQEFMKIPKGFILIHFDGDTLNSALENLKVYKKSDIMRGKHKKDFQNTIKNIASE